MDDKTIKQILDINCHFYESYAKEFSVTRQAPWLGWSQLLTFLSTNKIRVLDLGCGNGRFYKFLKCNLKNEFDYQGVDISKNLVKEAINNFPNVNFITQDFLLKNNDYIGGFDIVVGFGIMHHIVGGVLRMRLISNLSEYLIDGGVLVLTFWIQEPSAEKIKTGMGHTLEKNDYLVKWNNDKNKFRYVHVFDKNELEKIKGEVTRFGLELINEFLSDGKNGNSNVYLVWRLKRG